MTSHSKIKTEGPENLVEKISNPIKHLLLKTVFVPLLFTAIFIVISVLQAAYLRNIHFWVDHSDDVIRLGNRLDDLIAQTQTHFLRNKLMPLDNVENLLQQDAEDYKATFNRLKDLVSDNAQQTQRLNDSELAFKKWSDFQRTLLTTGEPPVVRQMNFQNLLKQDEELVTESHILNETFLKAERELRNERSERLGTFSFVSTLVISSLAAALCVFFILYGRKELRQIFSSFTEAFEKEKAIQDKLVQDSDALRRLNEVGIAILRTSDVQQLLEMVIDAAIAITKAQMGNIQLYHPESKSLRIVAQRGFKKPFLDFFSRVEDGDSACAEAMTSQSRIIVEDVAQSPIFTGTQALEVMKEAGALAVQSTPLIGHGGTFLGVFSTHWNTPYKPDERTLNLLDLLARKASLVIEHRLHEQSLQDAKDQAEKAVKTRDEFLSIASHELKTPLTSLKFQT